MKSPHKYTFKTYNGRIKIYIDGCLFLAFNKIDFKGLYAYKDDVNLYGIDLYLMNEQGGATTMEVFFKTKDNWLGVLKLLDDNM